MKILCVIFMFFCFNGALAQTCSSFNSANANSQAASDRTGHRTEFHNVSATSSSSCSYSPVSGSNNCAVECETVTTGDSGDYGELIGANVHVPAYSVKFGQSSANGGSTTCGGEVAGAVRSCGVVMFVLGECNISVGISGSVAGIGGSVSISSSSIWNQTLTYQQSCVAQTSSSTGGSNYNPPPCEPTEGAPYIPDGSGAEYVWDYSTCSYVLEPCSEAGCSSPIVIDTDGSGFHLSSAKEGVVFDFFGDKKPIKIAWIAKASNNGWLALDRNQNGTIDNARELFGNLTAQTVRQGNQPNGFAALAVFDGPDHGGNGDGFIDAKDGVWSKLLIWMDDNHDGVSQPSELHKIGNGHSKDFAAIFSRQLHGSIREPVSV